VDGGVTAFTRLLAPAARMLAVETLLADPEALDDDVLESCLYLLRSGCDRHDRLMTPLETYAERGLYLGSSSIA
jgi:hypothetical protein